MAEIKSAEMEFGKFYKRNDGSRYVLVEKFSGVYYWGVGFNAYVLNGCFDIGNRKIDAPYLWHECTAEEFHLEFQKTVDALSKHLKKKRSCRK